MVDRSWRVIEGYDQVAVCEGCSAGSVVARRRAAGMYSQFVVRSGGTSRS